jgi:hypothetical protein
MLYSDTTNKNGIIQTNELYCGLGDAGISGNSTLLKQFTNLNNIANSRIWHLLFMHNGGWKYDDSNNTDLPQATQDLTASTAKYALPTTALEVDRIEVKDASGTWRKLQPLNLEEITGAIDEFYKTDGFPAAYRLVGSTIELFPAPATASVTLTAGLKVYFVRGTSSFASSDTTKTPGFASEYHDMVPMKSSIEWLKINKPDSKTLLRLKEDDIKRELQLMEYETKKFRDKQPPKIRARAYSYN